ncbi:MAG: ComF family protein [Victivallales bacterium]|nr:ComF family protein [Victivallales bacterium]
MSLRLLHAIADFLAPPICPLCRQDVFRDESGLCAKCEAALPKMPERRCRLCGGPNDSHLEICSDCARREDTPPWQVAVAAFPFCGSIRRAIHAFKYQGQLAMAPFLARRMVEEWRRTSELPAIDFVTHIPLHLLRFLGRGYNQASVLAKLVAKQLGLPERTFLTRPRPTGQQARLSPEARRRNVAKAFQPLRARRFQGQSLLLIDDVFTTGATLTAAAQTLLKAGAGQVSILTVAKD